MCRRIGALVALLCVGQAVIFATTAKDAYEAALARERTVRPMFADQARAEASLVEVRSIVTAYRAIVKRYPASGYSDNALWQAARLSLDAFARFNDAHDRDAGVQFLRLLATSYPTSRLAKLATAQLTALEQASTTGALTSSPAVSAVAPSDGRLTTNTRLEKSSAAPVNTAPVEDGRREKPAPASMNTTSVKDVRRGEAAEATAKTATIKGIRRIVLPDAVRVAIELDAEVTFHEERISGPDRVFIDLSPARAVPPLVDQTVRFKSDGDVVPQVRIGRHPNHTTRIVLDATGVSSFSVYPLYNPYRLIVDCIRDEHSEAGARPLLTRRQLSAWSRRLPAGGSTTKLIRDALAPPLAPVSGVAARNLVAAPNLVEATASKVAIEAASPKLADVSTAAKRGDSPNAAESVRGGEPVKGGEPVRSGEPGPPAKNVAGGFSIARQLGLGVSRIVIDPGHGGYDPGAMGKGVTEAELVLDVALRVEKLLQKLPGVEVVLTRRTDEFVPLQERTAIANREGADLFLSIHANASENIRARGVETYFLNFANNLTAAAVAARENAASGQAMGALPDFVKAIALNNKLDESRDFATLVQRAMIERLRPANKTLKDLGVKQAPFVVLIGAAMPSVLAEISFVTNALDAKLLKSSAYRQRIAEALVNAVRTYQSSLKTIGRVAHQ